VDLRQVAEYPQIFYTPNSGLRPVVDRMFEQAKLQPEIAYKIEEDGSMAGLVAQNFGIALMPQIPILRQLDVDVISLHNQNQKRYFYMAQDKVSATACEKICGICKTQCCQSHVERTVQQQETFRQESLLSLQKK
jgi:DNA-binding transcriptional LysR family regulator